MTLREILLDHCSWLVNARDGKFSQVCYPSAARAAMLVWHASPRLCEAA